MIRYILHKDQRYIWEDPEFTKRIFVPEDRQNNYRYVNILSIEPYNSSERQKIRIYFACGDVLEGYTLKALAPITLSSFDELYDRRFNI